MIVYADGVDHYVGFLHQRLDLAFGVAAVVIAAVGDDEKRFLGIFRLPHLAHAEVNCVQQCGSALRNSKDQLALQVVNRLSEVGNLFRTVSKGNKEELVLRIGGPKKLYDGFAGTLDLARHTAAHIENDSKGTGRVFTREVS